MAVDIIDGTGSGYFMKVNSDGSINVGGISIGSISFAAGSTSYIPAGSVIVTNLPVVYPVSGIVNMGSAWGGTGSVYLTNSLSVSTGSESYVKAGSVIVTNFPSFNGSVNQNTSPWIVLGSVNVNNPSSVTAGSEVYVKAGSVIVTNTVNVLGSNYLIGFPPNSAIAYNPKTVLVYSGTAIGSIYQEYSTGSVVQVLSYDGSDNLIGVSAWSGA